MSFYISAVLVIVGFTIIGAGLLVEKDWPHKLAGLGFLLIAGVILTFAVNHTPGNEIKELDHIKCVQYVYSESAQGWNCVPREEAG